MHVSACGDVYTYQTLPRDRGFQIHNRAFLAYTARRLLQPIPDIVQSPLCRCWRSRDWRLDGVGSLDSRSVPRGDTALLCSCFPRTTVWHNAICDTLAASLRCLLPEAATVTREHDIYSAPSASSSTTRRPDVTVFMNRLAPQIVDVRTTTPVANYFVRHNASASSTSINDCVANPGRANARGEEESNKPGALLQLPTSASSESSTSLTALHQRRRPPWCKCPVHAQPRRSHCTSRPRLR